MSLRASRRPILRWIACAATLSGAWLFLAAIPALADGGPHVMAKNSGFGTGSTLTSDSCAGCHRAHTGKGSDLLAASSTTNLCLSCHGSASTGATTDVNDGVEYAVGSTTTVAGALRSGGFESARIDSAHPSRIIYTNILLGTLGSAFVPALTSGSPTTSAHMGINPSLVMRGIAWGNGGTGAGATLSLDCTSCHNPHGNGNYRILIPIPTGPAPFTPDSIGQKVTDAALPTGTGAAGVRNYTIMWGRTLDDVLTAKYPGGGTGASGGDYFRRYLPWNGVPGSSVTGVQGDRPMYVPPGYTGNSTNLTGFRAQITQWCATCHTRYDRATGAQLDTGDPIFEYRHFVGNPECTACHVAHGSNAAMTGDGVTSYSMTFPYPDDTVNPDGTNGFTSVSASSRLLKIDNRGTCQACHDPTHTVAAGSVSSPAP